MAKEGANVKKVVGKKKVNRYNRQECESEIARLANDSSKYKAEVQERLASLVSL